MRAQNPYKKDPEFAIWQNIKRKKIPMLSEWKHNYLYFLEDIGRKPTEDSVLKRKDTKSGYYPMNVFWYNREMGKPQLPEMPQTADERIALLRSYGQTVGKIRQEPQRAEQLNDDPFGQLDVIESSHSFGVSVLQSVGNDNLDVDSSEVRVDRLD
jgi:hypothetical protein